MIKHCNLCSIIWPLTPHTRCLRVSIRPGTFPLTLLVITIRDCSKVMYFILNKFLLFCEKWTNQHDTRVGQRKNLIPWQDLPHFSCNKLYSNKVYSYVHGNKWCTIIFDVLRRISETYYQKIRVKDWNLRRDQTLVFMSR